MISIILMVIWTSASVIASQFLVGLVMASILGAEQLSQPVWTAVYSALSYVLALLLIILVPAKIKKRRKKGIDLTTNKTELGLKDWPTWTDIGLAPIGFMVYLLLAAGLVTLFSVFPWFDAEQAQDVGFSFYITGADRVIAFFTLVVIAPIAEEIIFRGWLYGKLREKFSQKTSETWSVLISMFLVSVLFGVLHMQWNVGVNVFAMSIVLCGLREITGTIYSGILLHIIKNGVAFYLLFIANML